MNNMKNKGFVLIEIIIYVALFSIMIGGLLVSVFNIMQNSRSTENKITSESEMTFVVKKIDWLLTGASDFSVVSGTLKVTKDDQETYVAKNDTEIDFCGNSSCTLNKFPITTINAKVDELTFTAITGTPKGMSVKIVIDGNTATFSKYLRI